MAALGVLPEALIIRIRYWVPGAGLE